MSNDIQKTTCDACELEIEDNQQNVGHECNLHEWCICVDEFTREQLEEKYIDKIIECARQRDQLNAAQQKYNNLEHIVAKSIAIIIDNDKTPHYGYCKMERDKNAKGELPKTGRWAMPREIAEDLRNDMRKLREQQP